MVVCTAAVVVIACVEVGPVERLLSSVVLSTIPVVLCCCADVCTSLNVLVRDSLVVESSFAAVLVASVVIGLEVGVILVLWAADAVSVNVSVPAVSRESFEGQAHCWQLSVFELYTHL